MTPNMDRIRDALQFIPASDRDTWLRMGMAVKSELDDAGFDLWDSWSQQADSYESADALAVWKSIKGGGKVTAGTLFHEAKAHGWQPDGSYLPPTPEQIAENRRIAAERAATEEAETAKQRTDTATKAAAIWGAATEAKSDHPYLLRKRVSPVATLREIEAGAAAASLGYAPKSGGDALAGRLLVVPVKQGDDLSTLELIDGDKCKAALAGRGSKAGGYWATEHLPDGDGNGLTLLIGEGVATVLSGKEASGHPAIAALSAGNLPAVAKTMRERYPAAVLVILADLVKATGAPDHHAIEAAQSIGGKLAIPDFGTDRDPDMKDMNDLFILGGADAVKRAIASATRPAMPEPQLEAESAPTAKPAPIPGETERPCFRVLDDWTEHGGQKYRPGVWFFSTDKEGSPLQSWVCSPLHCEAVTHDQQENNFGRLLRFKTTAGKWREWSMPMDLLAGDGAMLRAELLAMGVEIDPSPKARNLLASYLQDGTPKRRIRCATQVGWCGDQFVLPDTVIGPKAAGVTYQSGERGHDEYTQAGTLDGWRAGIAARAVGNPLLLLALSASFAGPILALCNAESGGIHFVGDSSTGKTTALEAACATWGGPGYRRSWRATANGMEGAAVLFNDCLLALDEISECDPREVGAIVYALGNGRGKQRASRSGAARGVTRWRCFVISSGERTIATAMLEGGQRAKAGQAVRLLDIPAARAFGAWDDLHGAASAAAFSDDLKRAAAQHHGLAGRAFLEKLAHDTRDIREFCALLEGFKALPMFTAEGGEGQARRAAARFALIGMAGELATEYGVTGWPVGAAMAAAALAFGLWRASRGKGNDEGRQILDRVSSFIERHGDSRFSDADANGEAHVRERAGWWRDSMDERIYLFTADGMREALKGFDFNRGLDALQAAGALPAPGADGERAASLRIAGQKKRLYQVDPDKLSGSEHGA